MHERKRRAGGQARNLPGYRGSDPVRTVCVPERCIPVQRQAVPEAAGRRQMRSILDMISAGGKDNALFERLFYSSTNSIRSLSILAILARE